jgi:putative ABC transport system permease protein
LLGAATAVVAALLGTAVAWAVVTKVMSLDWAADPGLAAATAAIAITLTLTAGLAGTLRLLREKAAPSLRNE